MLRRTRILEVGAVGGAAVVALGLVAAVALGASAGVRMIERNERYGFNPTTLYVHAGDTVTWSNATDAPHTVTSDSGTELDSPPLAEGQTFQHAFTAPGTFAYHCRIHPYMEARVVVLPPGVTPPATATLGPEPQVGRVGSWPVLVIGFGTLGVLAAALGWRLSGRDRRS